jgi:ubiquitin carboxyl-terminal hydrolase 10
MHATSTLPLPASPAIPTSPPHITRLPNPELLALLSGTSLSGPPDSATQSRLRARGLINQGNMYFTNAVLQLLVYCPPFGNLFSDLGRLTGQRVSRLAVAQQDATVRLLDEFAYKKEDDDTEPFTSMYVYDAMKEKRQGIQEHAGAFLRPSGAAMLLICAGLPCIGQTAAGCGRISWRLPRRA